MFCSGGVDQLSLFCELTIWVRWPCGLRGACGWGAVGAVGWGCGPAGCVLPGGSCGGPAGGSCGPSAAAAAANRASRSAMCVILSMGCPREMRGLRGGPTELTQSCGWGLRVSQRYVSVASGGMGGGGTELCSG